ALEGRALGPTGRAVPQPGLDVREAQAPKSLLCFDEQVGESLDRIDARGEARQDRGLVAGPGPDLEHAVPAPRRERLGHQRHNQRLGNRLPAPDRQRRVFIGFAREVRREEPFARHPRHGGEHPAVVDTAPRELARDHTAPLAPRLRCWPAHQPRSAVAVPYGELYLDTLHRAVRTLARTTPAPNPPRWRRRDPSRRPRAVSGARRLSGHRGPLPTARPRSARAAASRSAHLLDR